MNKTVFIAGASSGIGKSLAELYASSGANLQIASRNVDELNSIATELKSKYKISVEVYRIDVSNYQSIQDLSKQLIQVPDIVICSIGYLGIDTRDFLNVSEIHQIFATNAEGSIGLINVFAALFKKSGKGIIVGISSIAGDRGKSKNLFYSSAKAAFTSYLDGLRNELYHHNVHVITVKPGYVDTPMTKGLSLPSSLIISSERAALLIKKAIDHKRNIVYVPSKWRFVIWVINSLPEYFYKKINWK
ncbi:MAG: SDR family NAD(P)-dependent oxidoreductase [Bacteroidetes bacterium]|nr:SDR family NAD(P)-dependent oxidoreductase [Bacteroidota bacterium]